MTTNNEAIQPELLAALNRRRGFTTEIINLLLKARRLLGLGIGLAIAQAREAPDPLTPLYSRGLEAAVHASQSDFELSIIKARFSRVQPRHRPHYSPADRFQILLYQQTYGLTVEETARRLLVSEQTIFRWAAEATKEPDKNTIGSLLKATPPKVAYSDVVRDLVVAMAQMGFGGNLKIAQTLARAGLKLSAETVRRWRKKPGPPRTRRPTGPRVSKPAPAIEAKHPNHVWTVDITHIRGLFGLFNFRLAVVLDLFSRMPMIGQVFFSSPTGNQIAALLELAVRSHGAPRHFVTDQGTQFTSDDFVAKLKAFNVKHRLGAIGQHGSIAVIERFWRTMKQTLRLKLWPPATIHGLHERMFVGLYYYAHHRPHQGIGGATPAEIYYGNAPANAAATRPRRAYEKNRADDQMFEIAYLDPERFHPVLLPEAA